MSEVLYPWGPQAGSSSGVLPFTLQIAAPFPAVQLCPSEAGGVFFDIQEVNGDTWFVTNAVYNTNAIGGAAWQQNNTLLNTGSINPANPAFAVVQRSTGQWQRVETAATNNVNTGISWTQIDQIDALGNQSITPLTLTANTQIPQQITATWNAGTAGSDGSVRGSSPHRHGLERGFVALDDLRVGGVAKWQVRKDGTLVTGIVPSSQISGPVPLRASADHRSPGHLRRNWLWALWLLSSAGERCHGDPADRLGRVRAERGYPAVDGNERREPDNGNRQERRSVFSRMAPGHSRRPNTLSPRPRISSDSTSQRASRSRSSPMGWSKLESPKRASSFLRLAAYPVDQQAHSSRLARLIVASRLWTTGTRLGPRTSRASGHLAIRSTQSLAPSPRLPIQPLARSLPLMSMETWAALVRRISPRGEMQRKTSPRSP